MAPNALAQNSAVPPLSGHVQDSLMSQIHAVYASTVRATIRREGEWPNLSYSHHLGCGARRLAARALEPLIERFRAATELMDANPDYAEARDLIQQARRVLDSAFDDLLRKAQIMGQTAFTDALKLDPSLWLNCDNEWGKGHGYRDRVAGWNQQWFGAEPRQHLEQELFGVISREWDVALKVDSKDGAEEGIRTPTLLRAPAPQAGASAVPPLPRTRVVAVLKLQISDCRVQITSPAWPAWSSASASWLALPPVSSREVSAR